MSHDGWTKASEAVRRLRRSQGTVQRASHFLAERAALGLLSSRAVLRIETRVTRGLDDVRKYPDEPAPEWVWAACREKHASYSFDWSASTFTAWDVPEQGNSLRRVKRVELFDVEFDGAQIDTLAPPEAKAGAANVVTLEPRDDVPALSQLTTGRSARSDHYMGLMEAVAWIGSRDWRLSDGTHIHLHEEGKGRPGDAQSFVTRSLLMDDLWQYFRVIYDDAEAELFDAAKGSDLPSFGRLAMGDMEPIEPLQWIDKRQQFYSEPDTIGGGGRNDGLFRPRWSHVCFLRADIIGRWPAEVSQPAEIPQAANDAADHEVPQSRAGKVTERELLDWFKGEIVSNRTAKMTDCSERAKAAFPGKVMRHNREQRRELFAKAYEEVTGETLKPGPKGAHS